MFLTSKNKLKQFIMTINQGRREIFLRSEGRVDWSNDKWKMAHALMAGNIDGSHEEMQENRKYMELSKVRHTNGTQTYSSDDSCRQPEARGFLVDGRLKFPLKEQDPELEETLWTTYMCAIVYIFCTIAAVSHSSQFENLTAIRAKCFYGAKFLIDQIFS